MMQKKTVSPEKREEGGKEREWKKKQTGGKPKWMERKTTEMRERLPVAERERERDGVRVNRETRLVEEYTPRQKCAYGTDRQTDRDRDSETETRRQTETETDRERDTERARDRETERHRDRETGCERTDRRDG